MVPISVPRSAEAKINAFLDTHPNLAASYTAAVDEIAQIDDHDTHRHIRTRGTSPTGPLRYWHGDRTTPLRVAYTAGDDGHITLYGPFLRQA